MVKISQKELKKIESRIDLSGASTYPKRDTEHGFACQAKGKRFDQAVIITFIHYRRRLIDPDGFFTKWILDQIVTAGILIDDSAKEIQEIRHRQEKTKGAEYIKIIIETP